MVIESFFLLIELLGSHEANTKKTHGFISEKTIGMIKPDAMRGSQLKTYHLEGCSNDCVYHSVTDVIMAVGINVFTLERLCYAHTHFKIADSHGED